jgi:hypothetical protein
VVEAVETAEVEMKAIVLHVNHVRPMISAHLEIVILVGVYASQSPRAVNRQAASLHLHARPRSHA